MALNIDDLYDKIYRYCYYKLHNSDLAEDITQETFLRFFESDVERDNTQSLKFLYTVARNLCIDEYRRIKPISLTDNDQPYYDNMEKHFVLKNAMDSLSEEDRDLIMLRYVNGVPMNVLSKMYKVSRFILYRRIKSILKQLRDQM